MTPQQIDAMKLALGQLQAGFVGNAMQILREALAEHAMRETQRLGQEIEPKIGCVNHDCDQCKAQPEQEPVVYFHPHKGFYWAKPTSISTPTIADVEPLSLYTAPPQRTWVELTDEDRNDCLVEADPCECLATPEAQELMRCVEAKLKELNHGK